MSAVEHKVTVKNVNLGAGAKVSNRPKADIEAQVSDTASVFDRPEREAVQTFFRDGN